MLTNLYARIYLVLSVVLFDAICLGVALPEMVNAKNTFVVLASPFMLLSLVCVNFAMARALFRTPKAGSDDNVGADE